MALIKCKTCGKEINKKASICPHCGVKTHPIKDVLKIVIIVIGVLIGLCLLGAIIVNGMEFISKKQQEKEKSKLIGTWELQTNNEYEFDGTIVTFDKTMAIKQVNNCESGDKTCVIYDEITFDKLVRASAYFNNKKDEAQGSVTICYTLDNDTLKQTPCPNEYDLSSQEMNITYKKVK